MQHKLESKTIVLIGAFDLSIIDRNFFIKNKIVDEADVLPSFTFFDVNQGQMLTNKIQISINAAQLVIGGNDMRAIVEAGISICNKLIETSTPIQAMGLNFTWQVINEDLSLPALSKKYFYSDQINLVSRFFNEEGSAYGMICSTDYNDARLKFEGRSVISNSIRMNVDVTANVPLQHMGSVEALQLQYNFHFEIRNKKISPVNVVNEYYTYANRAEEITLSFN